MSVQRSYQATFQIVNLTVGAGGSGVAVWRDTANNYLYIATAHHVIEGMDDGILIDYLGKKYTSFFIIIADKTYDFALVELRGVPTSIPTVTIAARNSTNLLHGSDIYVIGWPLLMDSNSISAGTIRSPRWTANGTMNQMLISAPVFGGNSGGGVFLKSNNQLVGVVSWGLTNDETINGLVHHHVILEALLYFMYRPVLSTPARISGESYLFGLEGLLIDPFTMQYSLTPSNSNVQDFGNAGLMVLSVLPNSPAFTAGFTSLVQNGSGYTFDILWGIRKTGTTAWSIITEENSLDTILYSLFVTANHSKRTILTKRSKGESANLPLDINLPANLAIECLVSRIVNDVHNNSFITRSVSLVKRNVYYNTIGDDPSLFGNEYLIGKRNDLRAQQKSVKVTPKTHTRELLSLTLKNSS